MAVKKLDHSGLDSWVDGLIAKTAVYGVKAKDDRFDFDRLTKASALRLDYDVTLLPPKRFFQPQTEDMATFRDGVFESVLETEEFVLFGVHPYDAAAVSQMDTLFSREHRDVHYMARREAATIVAVDVETVSENCFAGAMGFAAAGKGFDVLLTRIGEEYLVDARTEKGRALTRALGGAPDATAADLEARRAVWNSSEKRLTRHKLKMRPEELPALLEKSCDHPVWEEKARLCFSCGSCTLVCPTCYCFDVRDEMNWDLTSGRRLRTWDGCQLRSFALVAGGHNFRADRTDRYRHRYYRKGKYIPEKIGEISCVGCGRCITACVSKIANPPEIYNALLDNARGEGRHSADRRKAR
jgi:sulfhydrogenase subunit beta (sulfur reductase)